MFFFAYVSTNCYKFSSVRVLVKYKYFTFIIKKKFEPFNYFLICFRFYKSIETDA